MDMIDDADTYQRLAEEWSSDPDPFGETVPDHIAHIESLASVEQDVRAAAILRHVALLLTNDLNIGMLGETPADIRNTLRLKARDIRARHALPGETQPADGPPQERVNVLSIEEALHLSGLHHEHMDYDGWKARHAAEAAVHTFVDFLTGVATYERDIAPLCDEFCTHG